MERQFSCGSRQAPDPFDQYLEKQGYYRKHTARDSSCLFRVISEQLYDTQLHHLSIRQRCVDYMRKNRQYFKKNVSIDYEEYLDEMSKPKTYGTILELRAVAYLYRRNVVLFEAYNLGNWLIHERRFMKGFQVFFTPEKHFDSVFTMDYIATAGFCQALTYEVLYKKVFKLPDVNYAVEAMLYENLNEAKDVNTEVKGKYAEQVIFANGRLFTLDRPENTNCILENYRLCHFHNSDFPKFTYNLQCDIRYENNTYDKALTALLPDKYLSCVRQLLNEGITPFPYKVAKALDPHMYRNIEFDSWNEIRKEHRYNYWANGGNTFQFIFQVPYDCLQPLPADQNKPWTLPYRHQKYSDRIYCRKSKAQHKLNEINEKNKICNDTAGDYDIVTAIKKDFLIEEDINCAKDNAALKLKEFTGFQHFRPCTYEFITAPLSAENCVNQNQDNLNNSRLSNANTSNQIDLQKYDNDISNEDNELVDYVPPPERYQYGYYSEQCYSYPCEGGMIGPIPQQNFIAGGPAYYCTYNPSPYPSPNGIYPHNFYVQTPAQYPHNPQNFYQSPYYTVPNPNPNTFVAPNQMNTSGSANNNRRNVANNSNGANNLNHGQRTPSAYGPDLPADLATLRYFCHLGQEFYYKKIHNPNSRECPINDESNENTGEDSKLVSDLKSMKIEKDEHNQTQSKQESNQSQSNTQQSKRIHSRYFNNRKDKRSGSNRGRQFMEDNNKSNNYSKNNTKSHNNWNSKTSNVNNGHTEQTTEANSSRNAVTSAETVSDLIHQSAPIYSNSYPPPLMPPPPPSNFNTYPPFVQPEIDQSGAILQPPLFPVPYGVYTVPPAPPTPASGYASFVPPPSHQIPMPPAYIPQQSYYNQSADPSMPFAGTDSIDNNHFMNFNPVYYSPSGGPTTPIQAQSGGQSAQAFWVTTPLHPPPIPTPTQSHSGGFSNQKNTSNISTNSNNLSR